MVASVPLGNAVVEIMAYEEDVERLFSWLKTPDLRYREFAADRELADAAATWPGLRRGAAADSPAGERGAAEEESVPLPADRPSSDRAAPPPSSVRREPVLPETDRPAPPPGAARGGRDLPFGSTYRGFDDDERRAAPPPSSDPPSEPGEGQPPRSLDSVFSRLRGAAGRYREERQDGSDRQGTKPVFRRR
jgi:hypothetical protein